MPGVHRFFTRSRGQFLQPLRQTRPARRQIALVSAHSAPQSTDTVPANVASAPVTDQAVPEGHKSLHGYLYGEGDADAHRISQYTFRQGEDDGSSIVPMSDYLRSRQGEKPLGVYAIYDQHQQLQYVGYSRNIVLAVKGHVSRMGKERVAFIRPMVFANKAMASRTHMQAEADSWLAKAGTTPPGNLAEQHLWEGSSSGSSSDGNGSAVEDGATLDLSLLSPAERAEYEEKKLKLRKAMGENLMDDQDTDADAAQRRLALIAAVEGDNWSAVVNDQTQEALQKAVEAGMDRQQQHQQSYDRAAEAGIGAQQAGISAAAAAAGGAAAEHIVSPFSRPTVHRQVGEKHKAADEGATLPMTTDTIDKALDDVRPYLLADGGDVEVVGVEDGIVAVLLQGACSSCASSSATLKMGIERQLKAVFGAQVKEVIQVNSGNGKPAASVEAIDLHLNMLRSAVASLGGAVEVASVGTGVAVLHYKGPAAIGKGLVAAVQGSFPDIEQVVLKDFPAEP